LADETSSETSDNTSNDSTDMQIFYLEPVLAR
jgi:hypothetical protein